LTIKKSITKKERLLKKYQSSWSNTTSRVMAKADLSISVEVPTMNGGVSAVSLRN
jgi:hypothetical protein